MFGNHKGDEVISIPEAAKLIREELDKSIKAGKLSLITLVSWTFAWIRNIQSRSLRFNAIRYSTDEITVR